MEKSQDQRKALEKITRYSYLSGKTGMYVVPKVKAFEVDQLEDFFIIESILKNWKHYERY